MEAIYLGQSFPETGKMDSWPVAKKKGSVNLQMTHNIIQAIIGLVVESLIYWWEEKKKTQEPVYSFSCTYFDLFIIHVYNDTHLKMKVWFMKLFLQNACFLLIKII